jgi:hypothetical protein
MQQQDVPQGNRRGGGSGRLRTVNAVVASVCILIYLAAIAVAAIRIYFDFGQYRLLAQEEFSELADRAVSSAFMGFMSQPYQESVLETLQGSQTLEGIIISGFEGDRYVAYPFERVRGSSIAWQDGYLFKKSFGLSPEIFEQPLRVPGQGDLRISAVYNTINYPFVTSVLKYTLGIIAGTVALAFLTLFLGTTLGRSRRVSAAPETPSRRSGVPAPPFPREGAERSPPPQAPPAGTDFDLEDPPDIDIPEAVPRGGAEAGKERSGGVLPPEPYAPRGGIGREASTRNRLAEELRRAAAENQDLVFIILGSEDRGDPGEAQYRRFAAEAARFFGSRDFLFERGKGDMAAIIPGIDLDQGLARVEEFRALAAASLAGLFPEETSLRAGLSSRSGRPVDPDRLVFEAGAAMEKALKDPAAPVIAFRSDPEKYRAFIASQQEEVVRAVQNTRRP